MMITNFTKRIAFGATLAIGVAGSAHAADMRIAHGYPAGTVFHDAYTVLKDHVEANTDLQAEVFGMTLLDFKQASSGLTSGVADVALVLSTYFPKEFAEINLAADLTLLANVGSTPTSIGAVVGGAMSEYVMLNCPECLAQNRQQNQVSLVFSPGSQFGLLCRQPMNSLDAIKGSNIRASIAVHRRWAEAMGASPVSISGNEVFDGLNQGLMDCTVNAVPELSNLSLFEVVSSITPAVPGGTYGGAATGQVNTDFWAGLSVDDRKAVSRGLAETAAYVITTYMRLQNSDLEKAKGMGTTVDMADDGLKAATEAFITSDVETIKAIYKEDFGLQDVDAKVAKFSELLTKWKGLTDGLDPEDPAALAQLYWDEVMSKVDYETYGLN